MFNLFQSAETTPAKWADYDRSCKSSSGATNDQVEKFHAGTFTNESQVKKYIGCMLLAQGIINKNGVIQVLALKPRVPKDMAKDEALNIYRTCKNKKGPNVNETAYLLQKCFWEASPRHLQLDGI